MQAVQLTRTHRILIGVVVAGAVVIAAIGFAGSYAAVRDLAEEKDFGSFAPFFPIGIDAGIVVLLSLDLLLTWIRIPFPLLRQTAWLLTVATIAFNGAAAWPDALGVGMHAVIPLLFVVAVEAARHAVGRIADITADKHMDGVRISRWLLAFPSTFRLWRRMKLWELRSYDQVIRMEQDRLVYEARLHARYGRRWKRKAPVESLMPLRLARYGVPLTETGPAGLAAAGIKAPATTPGPAQSTPLAPIPAPAPAVPAAVRAPAPLPGSGPSGPVQAQEGVERHTVPATHGPDPWDTGGPERGENRDHWERGAGAEARDAAAAGRQEPTAAAGQPAAEEPPPSAPPGAAERVKVPVGPGRDRDLGGFGRGAGDALNGHPVAPAPAPAPQPRPDPVAEAEPEPETETAPELVPETDVPVGIPDGVPREEAYFRAYRDFAATQSRFPNAGQLARTLHEDFGITNLDGDPLSEAYMYTYLHELKERFHMEMGVAG
ncbi:DUF2637 domain-containing protein [Streptomyces sp. N2-109]|uniref:DUF2637 domain-containing protein n=1 Tax=Streptomyces gossypii TaxID=2883101 RepID=A0ABT2JXT6_9ACTN|nr:DUF2637 domain-containing protein [Streptomyces gossypii]MCT2592074.1 DUF2637 domain-containing protein [Streptomyces gossypii]